MLMNDVALELGGLNDLTVTKLEVLDEEACTVEGLLTADAGKLLINLMVTLNVTL